MFVKRKILVRSILISLVILIVIPLLMARCISFTMSDKKVKEYFKGRNIKPTFHSYLLDDSQIHFAEIGNDTLPTIIFVHGSPGSWDAFISFFKEDTLLRFFHIISVDRPGFGKSDLGIAEPSLERQAYLLSPILKLNKYKKPPILIGHSLGGPMIARIAMDYPEQVGGLIFVAPSIDPELEKYEWYRKPLKVLGKIGFLSAEIDDSNLEIMPLRSELNKMLPLWSKIKCPVTVIQGTADDLVPPGNADFAKKMLLHNPSVNIIMLPGVNHFIPWSHPEVIKKAIFDHKNNY